jgi:two-component system, sensor histidine kinase
VIAELTRAARRARPVSSSRCATPAWAWTKKRSANLFTRFYQADNSLRRRIGGTGLGLEISRNLARMMGGDIRSQQPAGRGLGVHRHAGLPEAERPDRGHAEP